MTSSAFPAPDTDLHALPGLLQRMKAAATADMMPDRAVRDERLRKLDELVQKHGDRFAALISRDFGHRPEMVTAIGDTMAVRSSVRHARKHLKAWMKTKRVGTSMAFKPGYNRIMSQPLGVVGIIGAWNYPLQLTLSPLVGALAAGNRAMLKPSELTPLFAETLKQAIAETFAEDEVTTVTGGPDVAAAFSSLPFDHLIFTGSTRTGRLVAQAAAKNLTPVTLELGGKSPVIVDPSADLATTADRGRLGASSSTPARPVSRPTTPSCRGPWWSRSSRRCAKASPSNIRRSPATPTTRASSTTAISPGSRASSTTRGPRAPA